MPILDHQYHYCRFHQPLPLLFVVAPFGVGVLGANGALSVVLAVILFVFSKSSSINACIRGKEYKQQ